MKINKGFLYAFVVIVVLLFAFSLYHRIPNIDDAWIGEQVYWLDKDGVVKNVLMKNYNDNHNRLLAYHKAFVYSGLAAVKLFGFGLWTLKFVSLFYLFVFFAIFYYYLVKWRKMLRPKQFIILAAVILIEPHIFEYAFVFRPEIMLMATGFLSFIFLEKSLETKTHKSVFVLLSATVAGLSAMVHLNGAVFVLAGGLILLFRKEFKNLVLFTIVSLFFVYLYFVHLNSLDEVSMWLHQLMAYDSGKSEIKLQFSTIIYFLLKPFEEQMRYFHSPKEIAPSLLLMTALFFGYKNIAKKIPLPLLYTLILVIAMGFIAPGKTPKYFISFIPFFGLIVVVFVKDMWQSVSVKEVSFPKSKQSISMFVVMLLFIVVSFTYNGLLSAKKFTAEEHRIITRQLVKKPVNEVSILAPMVFIFDEIAEYKEIIGLISFNERSKTDPRISSPEFFEICENENIDYILINDHYIQKFNLGEMLLGKKAGDYIVVGKTHGLFMLELQ